MSRLEKLEEILFSNQYWSLVNNLLEAFTLTMAVHFTCGTEHITHMCKRMNLGKDHAHDSIPHSIH